MNHTQRKYICEQIDDLTKAYLRYMSEDPARWEVPPITPEILVAGIKDGTIKLKAPNDCVHSSPNMYSNRYSFIYDLDRCAVLTKAQRDGKVSKKHLKATTALVDEAQVLKDKIILGDATEALAELRAFRAKYTVKET